MTNVFQLNLGIDLEDIDLIETVKEEKRDALIKAIEIVTDLSSGVSNAFTRRERTYLFEITDALLHGFSNVIE